MDHRMIQRLEDQLRDAHAANGDLRGRLLAQEKDGKKADAIRSEFDTVQGALAKAHSERKAAESNAVAAQRKQQEAERKLANAQEEIENLRADLERSQAEADKLLELNARIETAKDVGDLFGS